MSSAFKAKMRGVLYVGVSVLFIAEFLWTLAPISSYSQGDRGIWGILAWFLIPVAALFITRGIQRIRAKPEPVQQNNISPENPLTSEESIAKEDNERGTRILRSNFYVLPLLILLGLALLFFGGDDGGWGGIAIMIFVLLGIGAFFALSSVAYLIHNAQKNQSALAGPDWELAIFALFVFSVISFFFEIREFASIQ